MELWVVTAKVYWEDHLVVGVYSTKALADDAKVRFMDEMRKRHGERGESVRYVPGFSAGVEKIRLDVDGNWDEDSVV